MEILTGTSCIDKSKKRAVLKGRSTCRGSENFPKRGKDSTSDLVIAKKTGSRIKRGGQVEHPKGKCR